MRDKDKSNTIVVPADRLSVESLESLVEEFVTREGTDYGFQEVSVEQKLKQALSAVKKGDVLVIYNTDSESTQLVAREDYVGLAGTSSELK